MNHAHVSELGIPGQRRLDRIRIVGHVLRRLDNDIAALVVVADFRNPLAVSAVDEYERLALARQQRAHRRLYDERAASLQRHAHVRALAAGKRYETLPNAPVYGDELLVA